MLLGQDLGRRHERHLQAVLHGDDRRQQRDDRLAGAHIALQQAVHRLRSLQIVDDLLERRALPGGQLERQHAPRRFADAIVDDDAAGFGSATRRAPPRHHARLEQKRLFEDEAALRRRCEAVQFVDRRVRRRKMRGDGAPRIASGGPRLRRNSSGTGSGRSGGSRSSAS